MSINKTLNIHSTDPTNWAEVDATIIEGYTTTTQPAVYLGSGEDKTIRLAGFTIRNGGGSGISGGGGNTVIEYCHIYNNWGGTPFGKTSGPSFGKMQNPAQAAGDDRSYGGGIYGCRGTIQNCIIEYNNAELGGGLANCDGTIQNNIIANNSVVDWGRRGACGAALYGCGNVGRPIRGNTILNNTISGPGPNGDYRPRGGGMASCGGGGEISNNIVWDSRSGLTPEYTTSTQPQYCCIKGWKSGGQGNIATDPRLTWDWQLQPDSPCIDAGKAATGLPAKDLYGKTRGRLWRSQKLGDNSHTDIGASEFDPGPISLWVPADRDPGTAGATLSVSWVLAANIAPVPFDLTLLQGDMLVASLSQVGTAANHNSYEKAGVWVVILPRNMPSGSDYILSATARSASGLALVAKTKTFSIIYYNGVAPQSWNRYD